MSDFIDPAIAAPLRLDANLGIFWRLGTTPPARLWMGVNDYPVKTDGSLFTGVPSVDTNGDTYRGAGLLTNIPDLEVLINGIADRVEFYLSGVSAALALAFADGVPPVVGTTCLVGFSALDARWQPTTPIIPLWRGTADFWAMKQDATTGKDAPTRTIVLSCGSGDTGRSRPRRVSFTDSQQRLLFPDDVFFDRVSIYSRTYIATWPTF